MKTMVVPVDFTPTSDNALRYAVEWSKEYGYQHIILLKTLYDSLFGSMITAVDYMHVSGDYRLQERQEAKEQLQDLCNKLVKQAAPAMKVSLAVSDEPLLRSILDIVEAEKPSLVVLGSDHHSYSSESFIFRACYWHCPHQPCSCVDCSLAFCLPAGAAGACALQF